MTEMTLLAVFFSSSPRSVEGVFLYFSQLISDSSLEMIPSCQIQESLSVKLSCKSHQSFRFLSVTVMRQGRHYLEQVYH